MEWIIWERGARKWNLIDNISANKCEKKTFLFNFFFFCYVLNLIFKLNIMFFFHSKFKN
jgi:hypothetical protein